MSFIKHTPVANIQFLINHYSEADGVDVQYVCTTELPHADNTPVDVFYRATPHPVFGNRYFGIISRSDRIFITNADNVEQLEFSMMVLPEGHFYSRFRHDFNSVGEFFIDGGRAYTRTNCPNISNYVILNGKFIESEK